MHACGCVCDRWLYVLWCCHLLDYSNIDSCYFCHFLVINQFCCSTFLSTHAVIYHATSRGVSKSLRIHSMEFKPPATVSFNTGNTADIWRRWEQQFRIYFEAAELATKPPKTQVAILLQCVGLVAQTYLQTLSLQTPLTMKNWEHVLKKFKTYCEPRKIEVFERYKFWQRDQRQGENIDQWVNDLRILLSTCEYGQQKESSLRDRIVFGVAEIRVKERLLRESDLTLEKALDICHAAETSKEQMKVMASDSQCHEMNAIIRSEDMSVNRRKPTRRVINAEASNASNHHSTQGGSCAYCGSKHPPRKCPAYGVICSKCKCRNNFAKVCKGWIQEESQKPARDRSP